MNGGTALRVHALLTLRIRPEGVGCNGGKMGGAEGGGVGIGFDSHDRKGLDDGVVVSPGVLKLVGKVNDGNGLGGALGLVEVEIKGCCSGAGDEP